MNTQSLPEKTTSQNSVPRAVHLLAHPIGPTPPRQYAKSPIFVRCVAV
jgi:hypothetical protein